MKAPTKRQLCERIYILERRIYDLEYGISDHIVPFTADRPMEIGETMMVRVPRPFKPMGREERRND